MCEIPSSSSYSIVHLQLLGECMFVRMFNNESTCIQVTAAMLMQ